MFDRLSQDNVVEVLTGCDIVINGMDEIRPSIILERQARAMKKTIVDAWLTPYASVFVMKPDSPHWEDFLNFPTKGKKVEDITEEELRQCLRNEVKFTLTQFDTNSIISKQLIDDIITKKAIRPSLAPVVWISGTLMANEAMKIITGQGRLATHWGVFYNQYDHQTCFYDKGGVDETVAAPLKIAV